ncbi:hypothetical protein PRZ48_005175 [Zasmidium cellare]|uniref:Uncharacterized protein n=1 Tax=Zasmidium cellare TaxID=395010 RepID=A0ABR0ERM3_ZASCE|nr:hypothetical protein PRZ48_005175 [Zasmidium cellare]
MSPRRRRDFGDGLAEVERTASNVSSNASSDILVARPTQSTTTQQYPGASSAASHSYKHFPPAAMEASINNGLLFVRFSDGVARDRFRGIIRTKPKPVSQASNNFHHQFYQAGNDDDEDSTYGPNHRGTYSKEYTRLHPDIKWIHRGQGRYLPASEVKPDNPNVSPRPTRQTTEKTTGSVATSERTMEKMTQALAQHFDDFRRKHNPMAKPGWSPSFKHQFNLILNLIKTTPRHQWPKALELIRDKSQREVVRKWNKAMDVEFPMNTATTASSNANDDSARTRLSRQAKTAVPSIEQRRSTRLTDAPNSSFYGEDDDMAGDSDDSQDPDKTFRKEYVEAHPNETFHHTGNGWYKRGSRSESDKHSRRRDSTASHAIRKYSSSDVSRELDPGLTIHADDLHNYPGMTFHHKGNRYYKPGVGPTGKRGSITVASDGQVIRPDRRRSSIAQEEGEMESAKPVAGSSANEMPGTFSREYTLLHPEVDWVHRGGGRYRRKSSAFDAGTATPAASSERRSSKADNSFTKDYAESHISDEFRRSSGRRRSKPKIDMWDDEPSELFDKAYVLAHPEEEFHHRGQGRWARGTRPPRPAASIQDSEDLEPEGLFDSNYVHDHPDETFHHRGQGKWARGLPPPGSSNKTAVRGPGAQDKMAVLRSEEDTGPKPPPLTALLRREDGPDKWPNLSWQYRGGGKWCQVSKDEATRLSAGNRKPRGVGRSRVGDGPEAQLQREALAAERKANALQKPARVIRKRSGLAAAEMRSKGSSNSQSKAPTPRPPLLPPEEDKVTEEDLPSLFKEDWSDTEADELDEAAKIMRSDFQALIGPEAFVKALTKHDPAARSLDSLKQIAGNAQLALQQLQDEYLALDEIVARNPMHGKKERKAVKGGRLPVETAVWEDKKESILYDYNFDPRKIGYQDPDAQRIVRDDEGRELRRRRNRYGHDPHATAVDYGDGEMTAKRTIKPVSRFDGVVVQPPRKRSRLNNITTNADTPPEDNTPSATPDILNPEDYQPAARGRWKNHVPKRVLQLRGDSSHRSPSVDPVPAGGSTSPKPAGVRKGRPPGSKNLHKRKDAGIKKGPRKPKMGTSTSAPGSASASVEPEEMQGVEMMRIPAIVENPPEDVPPAAAEGSMVGVQRVVGEAMSLSEG